MSADQLYPYEPDCVVPPGAMLDEWRTDHGASPGMAARLIDVDEATYHRLVAGDALLTGALASRLHTATGINYRVWVALEKKYRDGLAAGKKRG